jgi:hypothetical protein
MNQYNTIKKEFAKIRKAHRIILKYSNPYQYFLKLNKGKKCKKTGILWTELSFAKQVMYYKMT